MRFTVVAALVLFAGAAQAQAPLTGTTGPIGTPGAGTRAASPSTPPSASAATGDEQVAPVATPPRRRGRSLQDRFEAANVTHDGHLTQEQARAKMPSVARDFDAIDTDHKGYVTIDQIRDHAKSARAARRASARAAKAQ